MSKDRDPIEYISLAEAAELCPYSQEYLSLRARQGKLRSVKLGRNWVTTKEWLLEYTKQAESYIAAKNEKNGLNAVFSDAVSSPAKYKAVSEIIAPPSNLPVGEPVLLYAAKASQGYALRMAFSALLVVMTLLMGVIAVLPHFYTDSLNLALLSFLDYSDWMGLKIASFWSPDNLHGHNEEFGAQAGPRRWASTPNKWITNIAEDLGFAWRRIAAFITGRPDQKDIAEFSGLSEETSELEENIIQDIQKRFGDFRNDMSISQGEGRDGLVVVPSGDRDEEVKQKIRRSFSDEVAVEPKDENSGIIRPIFRQVAEQAYLYMLVPIRN